MWGDETKGWHVDLWEPQEQPMEVAGQAGAMEREQENQEV